MKILTIITLIVLFTGTSACVNGQKTIPMETIVELAIENSEMVVNPTDLELSLSIINTGKTDKKICTYNTPFEGFKGEFLEIKNKKGKEIEYMGIMLKRGEPTEKDFILIPAGESKSVKFKISEVYDISGKSVYTITFIGNEYQNELPNSNTVSVTVK